MKRFYSILAWSTTSVRYPDPLVFIEPGINAFTVTTDDLDSLLERLRIDGIRVDKVNALDGSDEDLTAANDNVLTARTEQVP